MVHELRVHQIELEMQNAELRTAQVQLDAVRARYFNLYDMAPVGYFALSEKGLILEANLAAATLLCVPRSELTGHPITRFIHKADQDIYYLHCKQLCKAAVPHECELRMEKMNGTPFWALLKEIRLQDADGAPLVCAVISDIAERKRVEEMTREAEEQLRAIMENAPDGVYMNDLNGNFIFGNRKAEEITGYTREEILGKNMLELNLLPQEEIAKAVSLLQNSIGGKTTGPDELTLYRKDGSRVIVEINTSLVHRCGQPVVIGFVRDITARKLSILYEDMKREILQILNEPTDLHDLIQSVVTVLKTRTGFDAVGIRLQDGDDFPFFAHLGFPMDFLQTENTLLDRSADGEVCRDKDGNVRLECTCGMVISGRIDPANPNVTPGGSFWTNDSFTCLAISPGEDSRLHPRNQCIHRGYASLAWVPIRNKGKNIGLIQLSDRCQGCFTLETVQILEEIASHIETGLMRKWAEKAILNSEMVLRASLAEKEALLKEVHHRVKNNLSAIIGLLDLQWQMMDDKSARADLAGLSARISSIALVHEQLYQSDNFSRINFHQYLKALIAHLRSSSDHSADILVRVAAEGIEMGLDCAVPCGIVITELVTNAIKYAFPADRFPEANSREIAVSGEWDGVAYTLTVADNGVGLPANLDWTNTKTLGLLLVKMLGQHQLQGRIDLDLTCGTEFRLRFVPPGPVKRQKKPDEE